MLIPTDCSFTKDHEWVRLDGRRARVGITDYAQDALGDVVFVDVPSTGRSVQANEAISEVESTKSVSSIYAPVTGIVVDVNEQLAQHPELVNSDPYGDGWLCVIEVSEGADLSDLLDAASYEKLTES